MPTIEFSPANWRENTAHGLDSIGSVWAGLKRHKLAFFATFLLVAAATAAFILWMPAKYQAEARLFITRSRVDAPVTPDMGTAAPVQTVDVSEAEVTSEMELLKSRDLLSRIIDLGLLGQPIPNTAEGSRLRERLLRQLDKDLKVAPVKKTSLISILYSAKDSASSANVVNQLADLYLEKHMAIHRNRETSEFFSQQAAYYQAELSKAEKELQDFQEANQSSLLQMQKEATLKRGNDMEAAAEDLNSQIRDAEDRARELRRQINVLSPTVNAQNRSARNEPLIATLKGQLLELQNKRTELLTKYEPTYRLVQEVDKQIRDTSAALDRETSPQVVDRVDALNPVRQSIESDLLHTESIVAGLKAKQRTVSGDNRRYRSKQKQLGLLTAQDEDLRRRVKIAEENYLLYHKRQEEARIAEALDRQKFLNVSIVERAAPPALPAERHRSLIALLGVLVASFLALAAALVADYLDRPVRNASQLAEASGLPVLASLTRSDA